MCSNYDPVLDARKLKIFFDVSAPPAGLHTNLWPGQHGPFVRPHAHADAGDEAVPFRELLVGSFGLIPFWAKDTKIARNTYNARSETVSEKPSFKDAWRQARHCIIPAEAIFEPDWRSGKAVHTKIVRTDGKPMGIAGLWAECRLPRGGPHVHSFTMLTINADDHPFMNQYHHPDKEKRMLVILQDDEYDAWLNAGPVESRKFIKQFPAELMSVDHVATLAASPSE